MALTWDPGFWRSPNRAERFPRHCAQQSHFPNIVSGMGKHCDLGHIVDPASRNHPGVQEENPRLNLTNQETSLAFDLIAPPDHKGHIIAPGDYRLNILIAAENARRIEKTVSLSLKGRWFADETRMLSNGVGVTITDTPRLPRPRVNRERLTHL